MAATQPGVSRSRELSGDKAARIVEAMRTSVAARGIAGSTFDHVANEAGVSRGLLHYYFGSKERLLVEVVRRESEVRIERVEEAIVGAADAEDVLAALVRGFEEWVGDGPAPAMIYEMLTLAQRNDEIAAQLAELGRRVRSHLAGALERKQDTGVLSLQIEPELAAMFLIALADGVMVRRLSEPELDIGPLVEQAIIAARAVLS
ncbi:MAG TPA: TetR/AcrR family transcriptional regulator [Solirubrobacteraceae bacterium]|nr:TetR/AcrR family transcriptional regulator [Solirubrobacteraceae bacterium]HUA70241.1 TetR/AcrR family transcriptional regulator [Solirubrobacteraceae bacterium]